jgi:hypothetical protein
MAENVMHARLRQHRLVVVERQGVGADGDAEGVAAELAGREDVLLEAGHVGAGLLGRREQAALGERRDDGVVDEQEVGRVALLAGEERLAREVGGVVAGALDGDAGLGAALLDELRPVGGGVELGVRVPERVGAAGGGSIRGGAASGGAARQGQAGDERAGRDGRARGAGEGVHGLSSRDAARQASGEPALVARPPPR